MMKKHFYLFPMSLPGGQRHWPGVATTLIIVTLLYLATMSCTTRLTMLAMSLQKLSGNRVRRCEVNAPFSARYWAMLLTWLQQHQEKAVLILRHICTYSTPGEVNGSDLTGATGIAGFVMKSGKAGCVSRTCIGIA